MAYDLVSRFSAPEKCCMLLEPCAYQREQSHLKPNKIPFLARTPRLTSPGGRLWTHAIYNPRTSHKIQNCASLKSKCSRFPYESFNEKDLELLLCRCGIENECVCPTNEDDNKDVLCQGKVRKKLFIGPTPKSVLGDGLSAPYKSDHDSKKKDEEDNHSLYNTTGIESNSFYHGCKWSNRTSKRSATSLEMRPGPADYFYVKIPSEYENCMEKLRAYRRKTSRQLRFIEMVQQKEIMEGLPGPASYNPALPKGYEIEHKGPKEARFNVSKIEQRPGPTDHWVKRLFDPPEPPTKPCHVKLPAPSFFGIKAIRFKARKEEGPSPATYSPVFRDCQFVHCPMAAFSSSTARFKETPIVDSEENLTVNDNLLKSNDYKEYCSLPSWQFRSNTIRMKPLIKNTNAPSPADLPQSKIKAKRSQRLQMIAPFSSSEGRFEPWSNWMAVFDNHKSIGPCYYALEKPKCLPAVARGPLYRSPRFQHIKNKNPSPNKYNIGGGVETILATHNQRLKVNIESKYTFIWKPPLKRRHLSYEERENLLLQKSIALLDTTMPPDENNDQCFENKDSQGYKDESRSKLLRCFVKGEKLPQCF